MTVIEPRRLVVGVAMGEDCDAALEFAAAEALRRGCGVHLVHAMHPVWAGPTDVVDLRLVDGELRKVGVAFLQDCQRRVEKATGESITVSTEIVHEAVVPALNEMSQHADLVVLQHHRMGRSRRIPTLSVTNGVAARAHAPVVAVPDTWHEDAEHPDVVAVGVEDYETSAVVAEAAFEEARRLGAGLRLVRAWYFSAAIDDEVFSGAAGVRQTEAVRAEVENEFAALMARFPDVTCTVDVTHGRPAEVLVERSEDVRLLVVGRHQPALPFGSHLGPVTRAVLGYATCPVLVVNPRKLPE